MGIRIWSQGGFLTGLDFGNTSGCLVDESLEDLLFIVHPLVDHDLDTVLRDFERLDQGGILGDADRGLGFHFRGPVSEGKCLVCRQRADVNFDDATLENVVAELLQHLCLGRVNYVTEIHVILEVTLEGYFHGLGDGHGRFAGGESEGHGSRVSSESDTLGHTGVGVTADDDRPFVHGEVIENLVDHVGHGVVFTLRVTSRDESEAVHELHQLGNVCLGLLVPDRGGVAAGLVSAVDGRRNDRRGHGLELLRGHETSGVLGAHDIYFHANIRAGV